MERLPAFGVAATALRQAADGDRAGAAALLRQEDEPFLARLADLLQP